jgi:small conductance mechanosensitive channel
MIGMLRPGWIAATSAIQPVFPSAEKLAAVGLRVILTLLAAFVVQRLLFLLVSRVERFLARSDYGAALAQQRAKTFGQILRNGITVFVVVSALVHILALLGWDVRPILAGAGILGVALGFGAQTLVRDLIAGLFILAENQFDLGDLIEIDGKPATVEALTVRSTTLRDFNGYVHFVPNGEMKTVVNRSRGWNRMAVDIVVPYGEDVDRALAVCRDVAAQMSSEPEWRDRLLDPLDVWGLESMGGPEVHVRVVVRTRPGPDLPDATRELRLRAHRALARAGIHTHPARDAFGVAPASPGRAASGGA